MPIANSFFSKQINNYYIATLSLADISSLLQTNVICHSLLNHLNLSLFRSPELS